MRSEVFSSLSGKGTWFRCATTSPWNLMSIWLYVMSIKLLSFGNYVAIWDLMCLLCVWAWGTLLMWTCSDKVPPKWARFSTSPANGLNPRFAEHQLKLGRLGQNSIWKESYRELRRSQHAKSIENARKRRGTVSRCFKSFKCGQSLSDFLRDSRAALRLSCFQCFHISSSCFILFCQFTEDG